MKTITFNIQKGGTGKTTSASALSHYLASKGYNVLMVDMDPQANMTLPYQEVIQAEMPTAYDMMQGKNTAECIAHISDKLHIIAGSLELASADMTFTSIGREYILKKALEQVKNDYDICVIDTPPTLNILNINALSCSDGVIIPITPDKFALNGVKQLKQVFDNVKEYSNPNLELYGVLVTKYDTTSATDVMISQAYEIADYLGTFIYDTKIRNAVAIRKAQDIDASIFDVYPREKVTADYKAFCEDFIKRYL